MTNDPLEGEAFLQQLEPVAGIEAYVTAQFDAALLRTTPSDASGPATRAAIYTNILAVVRQRLNTTSHGVGMRREVTCAIIKRILCARGTLQPNARVNVPDDWLVKAADQTHMWLRTAFEGVYTGTPDRPTRWFRASGTK